MQVGGHLQQDPVLKLMEGSPIHHHLENFRDRGAWWAAVHGVTKSWIQLKLLTQISISQEHRGARR